MLKDITLGQYFPGTTVVHKLDPRTKILLTVIYIAALFVANSFVSYAVMLICLVAAAATAKIKAKALLQGLKPLVIIIIINSRNYCAYLINFFIDNFYFKVYKDFIFTNRYVTHCIVT